MTEPRRILIHVDSDHEQSLAYGLGGVEAIYTQHAAENPDVVLLTHTKHQLESTGLSRMLGRPARLPTLRRSQRRSGS
ncbi:MAG: hypothetical protein WBA36_09350 [Mesorhizobium sp.]